MLGSPHRPDPSLALRARISRSAFRVPRSAFTLIELLVVIGIIVALVGAIFAISNSVFAGAKEKSTKAMMLVVQEAIDEFQRNAPLAKVGPAPPLGYATYYNNFPPDALDVYVTATGYEIPIGNTVVQSISPGVSQLPGDAVPVTTNKDLKAMILAIRLFSPTGSAILDRLDSRYTQPNKMADSLVRPAVLPATPTEYLDRDADGTFNAGDRPLEVIVDDWGQPIEYFGTRLTPTERVNPALSPAFDRQKFSTDVIAMNNNQPVLMSYGPDGPEQLSNEVINLPEFGGDPDKVTVWYDYMSDATPKVMDNKYNLDNVFANEAVKTRLMEPKP